MSEETTKIHGVDYLTWGRMDWAARCQVIASELYKTKERLGELETEAVKDGMKIVVYKLQIEALEKERKERAYELERFMQRVGMAGEKLQEEVEAKADMIEELQKIVANYHGSEKLMNWMLGDDDE